MIDTITSNIEDAIRNIDNISVERYFGQLSTKEEPDIEQNKLPIIFVDFTGYSNKELRDLNYNLYYVHISYSQAKEYKQKAQKTITKLLTQVEEELLKIAPTVKILQAKKIFDAKISKGYLTIFTQQVQIKTNRGGCSV